MSQRTALITGGTTGIGAASARVLHAEGWTVAVTGTNQATLAEAERSLPKGVVVLRSDSRSSTDRGALAAELGRRFGTLDLVFLNAGIGHINPLEAVEEAAYDACFDVSVKGQFFTLQKLLPLLGEGSSVVFNSALGAHRGVPHWSVYSAAKAAVLTFTRALAVELAPRRIRVNAVTPGGIETPAISKNIPAAAIDGVKAHMQKHVPLGRLGRADEVAGAVAFLGSPAASFITGTEIVIDGGHSVAVP